MIRDLVRNRKEGAWIGITDSGKEGNWRFPTTMKQFDPSHHGNLFHWHAGEPNNGWGNQDCARVGYGGWDLLDDADCEEKFYGLCEVKVVDCDVNVPYHVED